MESNLKIEYWDATGHASTEPRTEVRGEADALLVALLQFIASTEPRTEVRGEVIRSILGRVQ